MFLKRSLVTLAGILVFIGVFLLRFHLADAHIQNTFREERMKFGVADTVLTLPEAEPPPLHPAVANPPPAPPAPAPTPSDTSSDAPTPPPGSAPDTNTIIGPVLPSTPPTPAPDSSTPDSNSTPAPSAPSMPAPDTNADGPMAPPSTMNEPPASPFQFAAYDPSREALSLSVLEAGQSSQFPTRTNAPAVTPAPASTNASTNAPTVSTETNAPASAPATNAISSKASAPAPVSPKTEETSGPTNGAPVTAATSKTEAPSPLAHAVSVGGRAIVLGYHQFTGPGVPSKNIYSMSQDVFETEMKYLQDNGYHVIPLSDVVRFVKHEIGLPPNAVAITIDDGYKSAINYAAPVLKKYHYPWTFFVYPEFITRTESKGAASWPDLLALQADGVDIESHSMTHPQLTKKVQKFNGTRHLLSPDEYDAFLTSETAGAKAILEKELGKPIPYFAYPYGDYNKVVEAKAVAAGYEAIFTVADNPVHITTDIHSIGRYIITKPVERNFAAYLRQGALSLAEVNPAPGAITSDPRPVITAVLGFNGDPKSLETEVRDFGTVRHDFDPQTSTVRLYLPRDLIQPDVIVNIRAKDAQSGQTMVANWHFEYEPSGAAPAPPHPPISATAPTTNSASASKTESTETVSAPAAKTNAAPVAASEKAPTHAATASKTAATNP
jgi:peptidoglycan/xylan/chitin deacetylase (PgdA/CDA1 family)